MSPSAPTSASLLSRVRLIYLAIISPEKFDAEEQQYNALLDGQLKAKAPTRITLVRRALFESFVLCVGAIAFGVIPALVLASLGLHSPELSATVIVAGTAVLLWATLALQGWDIQTWRGVTLTEQVNKWIFRSLYTIGTFLITWGSAWAVMS